MVRVQNHRNLVWLASVIGALMAGWAIAPSAVSQPVSPGRIGPARNDPLPHERIISHRFVWFSGTKSAAIVFRTANNREYSIRQLGTDDLHSLLSLIRQGDLYYEADEQLLYSPVSTVGQ